jgi:hypothetical protein
MAFLSPKNEVAGTITGDGQPEKEAMRRGRALALWLWDEQQPLAAAAQRQPADRFCP